MKDRRTQERERAGYHAEVIDTAQGEILGHLVDISAGGLMLVGELPLPVGREMDLAVEMPRQGGGPLRVRAVIRWCEPDLDGSLHLAGVEFVAPDLRAVAAIQRLRRLA